MKKETMKNIAAVALVCVIQLGMTSAGKCDGIKIVYCKTPDGKTGHWGMNYGGTNTQRDLQRVNAKINCDCGVLRCTIGRSKVTTADGNYACGYVAGEGATLDTSKGSESYPGFDCDFLR
ncbi:hypothetical protein Bealeia1_00426 [Candidatus Bealeia paramacronuclearis]|uniref:DUF2147 domain-containing protein n=1 Tax=Candidatus Bealeia paramacronuclearis TaxID=1921001 RepID=A0ABZ2C1J1_9PROT|nr:hypothetical protein [Candidatus Bealeia paramacronuclearis]